MKKSTWILMLVLAVLAGATYLVLQRPGENSVSDTKGTMLVEYDSAAIDKIEIRSKVGSVIIEKQGGSWMLTFPVRYKADDNAIALALGNGRKIALTSLVSTNPEKQRLFELDSSGTVVRMSDRGTEKAAFFIGKPGPSYTETYVRRDGSNDVHLASGFFSSIFLRAANDWRDKNIFKADQNAVTEITFHYRDTVFVLRRPDSLWQVDRVPANQSAVTGLLTALTSFQADAFIDTALQVVPPLTAQIDLPGTQIRFYRLGTAGQYLVQSSNTTQLFEVNEWRASQLLKRKKDLLESGQ